jgi:hypothetical protein
MNFNGCARLRQASGMADRNLRGCWAISDGAAGNEREALIRM